ncbi:MAG: hypothetical protein DRJ67_03650 [Thermoprotei archaeon]|nr:MAG: hypothetical protein DRJ67_03650 [Thermoprotei archaeon]
MKFRLTSVYSLLEPSDRLEDSPGIEIHYKADKKAIKFEDCMRLAEKLSKQLDSELVAVKSSRGVCTLFMPAADFFHLKRRIPEEVEL